MTVWRAGTMLATLAGVMAVLGVVRTTRGDEEAGRTELVRSGSVGRHAPTAAAVLVALGGGIVLGLLVVLGMVAAGTPVAGSVAYGAGLAGTSAVFVGVGAVASQLAKISPWNDSTCGHLISPHCPMSTSSWYSSL